MLKISKKDDGISIKLIHHKKPICDWVSCSGLYCHQCPAENHHKNPITQDEAECFFINGE